MKQLNGYMAGANLGHWISQYGQQGEAHFDSYITEPDIARMASWGMDHVRLPVDYFFFERDDNPGVYREERLSYIDNCLCWCKKNGMNLILDLHHAPGFAFAMQDADKTLMTQAETQERYLAIWAFFAQRYQNEGDNLVFELLNELVWKDSIPWNGLWKRAVDVIQRVNTERRVIVGSNYYNSVTELCNLAVTENPNVIYTFHMYEPFLFTHQTAPWVERTAAYCVPVEYPVDIPKHSAFFTEGIPPLLQKHSLAGKDFIAEFIQPAKDWLEQHDGILYCGEYGVFHAADLASTVRFHEDVAALFLPLGIGRAVWSYRGFAQITDEQNRVVSQALVRAVSRH